MTLGTEQFRGYFHALWGHDAFPWQRRLAHRVCGGRWPDIIDLPTASGKTACLDVAVFALAVQASLPPAERAVGRRIFFVVNRRVIVDEAYERARLVAEKLAVALRKGEPGSILRQVAEALKRLSGDRADDVPPLDVALLRGGIYRDNRWSRSITQPTIITSTIDQVGSRLLFRGYGVSDAARPMHAALVAHDSTLLLDEAHISQPFAQTLEAVRRYRGDRWARQPVRTPFAVVPMTATPGESGRDVLRLDEADRKDPILAGRLNASKEIDLVMATRARGKKAIAELADLLASEARKLVTGDSRNVAIVVNRVATARAVYERLRDEITGSEKTEPLGVALAIGRMRPIDRDELTRVIQRRVGSGQERNPHASPLFVVATQCLEVGADFDFDAMVSECASLDALRQRFGRLNRRGRRPLARGCIIVRADQTRGDDPIYGTTLAETWKWLQSIAVEGRVDFGIAALERTLDGVNMGPLLAPRADAPVMFPAYLDAWAQTNPAPAPDPDISLFLHGPGRGEPDVNVCWRADLPEAPDEDGWKQVVGLCPPSSPECMPVPIGIVRGWLAKRDISDEERSDLLEAETPQDEAAWDASRAALAWRGPSESRLIRKPSEIRPGDTLVLSTRSGGWSVFGHIPNAPTDPAVQGGKVDDPVELARVDIAERAYRLSRGRAILRLGSSRLQGWPDGEATRDLAEWIEDPRKNLRVPVIRDLLRQVVDAMPEEQAAEAETLRLVSEPRFGMIVNRHDKEIVLTTRRRVPTPDLPSSGFPLPAMDDGDDETSRTTRVEPVALNTHLGNVSSELASSLRQLTITSQASGLRRAAELHDWGKADERFQALLINGDLVDVAAQPTLWAKSSRYQAAHRGGLPRGFRHEMLSVQLAERAAGQLPTDADERDLVLHLIASHHGHARPFAPVVQDEEPPDVSLAPLGLEVEITTEQRVADPLHRLDSGVAERFWKLTRRFGWWGLAYLETVLRMADQRASAREDRQDVFDSEAAEFEEAVS